MTTVPMTCHVQGRLIGTLEVDRDRAYEYEARSPWNDLRGPTVWAFVHPEHRLDCQRRWRQAHPLDSI
jgi:hypothetical protein